MKKIFETLKSLKTGTKVRTVLQFVAFVNQFVALIGVSSFAANPVYQWLSLIFTVVVSIFSYWYNNDWTGFAKTATDIFDMLSDGKITQEEMTAFISKHKKTTKEIEEELKQDISKEESKK